MTFSARPKHPIPSDWDRILKYRVILSDGCWEWSGSKNPRSKNPIISLGRTSSHDVRRVVFALQRGMQSVPTRIGNSCPFWGCINPEHLVQRDDFGRGTKGDHYNVGEGNGMAKLNREIVNKVRTLGMGGTPVKEIAFLLDISKGRVYSILGGRSWKAGVPDTMKSEKKTESRRWIPASGSRHYKATMTEEQVLEGIRRCGAGETIAAVAADLGVKEGNLGDAVRGRTWKHLHR